ncbi:phosducin-like protein [Patella vulgata]|uniref:phosducin-like protein n=1 Tax=Patella vulgata TaxID=6465 RepID=UPI00217FE591|nr:phosducin-like protein [Patella vulgata]
MALSLDDKLLGEKTHYYCSSDDEDGSDREESQSAKASQICKMPEIKPPDTTYKGYCTNTGPKGVVTDWREFKRLETEKRIEQEKEKQALATKLTLTCRSHLDDEIEKQKDDDFLQELEELEDDFLKEYRLKRLEEMRKVLEDVPKFGKVYSLTSDSFIDAVDKEKPQVTVIVHLYEDNISACEAMNGSLLCLAQEYPTVKFCKLKASEARLSYKFSELGVPALLIYKNHELIGNLIKLSNHLGDDFYAVDVESYLLEYGFLPDKDLIVPIIRDKQTGEIRSVLPGDHQEDSGSDFDID